MNSRLYQNILHVIGISSSVMTIYGVMIVGSGKLYGLIFMILGAIFLRISSEIEFQKMSKLIEEKRK